ncbi:putative deacetylase [Pseudomonas sp. M47T1]|nr:putative deacetylase [Pseudomonas sp. M47T1]
MLIGLALLVTVGVVVAWWLPLVLAVLGWIAHEAWFADHLFYSPAEDYRYDFEGQGEQLDASLQGSALTLAKPDALAAGDTLVLEVGVRSGWLGRFLDPRVELVGTGSSDCQTFERGVRGLRYLNLSGLARPLADGSLRLQGRYCALFGTPRFWRFPGLSLADKRLMVIAPHADDAELAAYGLYSRAAAPWIVTLTAGEIEAQHYQHMGLPSAEAARLKGRLRAWDSLAVPRWAGVPHNRCVQLGYFCLQLPAMRAAPDQPMASREAELEDIRLFRALNDQAWPADRDGKPTWHNLLADLRAILDQARPEVIVLPDAVLDPHPDHICSRQAVIEALQGLEWQPQWLLGYANHLHDNDRWPMGEQGQGIALPPLMEPGPAMRPLSLPLSLAEQRDKAMALGMMHDLQPPMSFKRRLRRTLQHWLAGRRHSAYGENEFFRKMVRNQELFWVIKRD